MPSRLGCASVSSTTRCIAPGQSIRGFWANHLRTHVALSPALVDDASRGVPLTDSAESLAEVANTLLPVVEA